jgi:hypothetical protein
MEYEMTVFAMCEIDRIYGKNRDKVERSIEVRDDDKWDEPLSCIDILVQPLDENDREPVEDISLDVADFSNLRIANQVLTRTVADLADKWDVVSIEYIGNFQSEGLSRG